MHRFVIKVITAAGIIASTWSIASAAPVATAITYQGQLKDGGAPANAEYDMTFSLYEAEGGGPVAAGPLVFDGQSGHPVPVSVVNGLFQVYLDFGNAFDGSALWLQIEVRPHATGNYISLTPRQPLTATPFALYALDGPGGAGPWTATGGDIHNTNTANVGVGTDLPAAKLHVAGDIRSDGPFGIVAHNPNNVEAVAALGWFNDAARIRIGGDGPGSTGGLDIQKTGDRSLMRIYDSGDVWCRGGVEVTGDALSRGSLRSSSPTADSEVFLGWGVDGVGAEMARIRIGGSGVGAYNGLDIQAVGNRSLMRITDDGSVGIGTPNPANRLSIVGSANISARLGVGLSAPLAPVHVGGGSDVSPSGGGIVVVGGTDQTNIAIDNNEIMARNNGGTSTLYLNSEGGRVVVGGDLDVTGTIDIGYEVVHPQFPTSPGEVIAQCPPGKRVIGGGCGCGDGDATEVSRPTNNNTAWLCHCDSSGGPSGYAICANVK